MKRLVALLVALLAVWIAGPAGAVVLISPPPVSTSTATTRTPRVVQLGTGVSEPGPPAIVHEWHVHQLGLDATSAGSLTFAEIASVHTCTTHDRAVHPVQVARVIVTSLTASEARRGDLRAVSGASVAANIATRADIAGARFAQNDFSETFSTAKGARFSGRTIDDVAGDLSSGALSPKDVPIDVIVRDGNTLILNTRSSQALIRAGIPRSSWNVIDRTGRAAFESRLTGQLTRNGLMSYGTELP